MKKLLVCLLIALLPLLAAAEELYPAKGDNGLWGYINAEAAWIIAPQFNGATPFRGDYAVVTVDPPDYADAPENDDWVGIIDRTGAFVMEPIDGYIDPGYDSRFYGGEDTGIWIISTDEGDGFFDIPSGYCSEIGVEPWTWVSDSCLIPVEGGYMDRTNGEMVIRGEFYGVDPACFYDGIASVSYVDMKGNPIKFFMMNEKGDVIPLPEGVSSTYAGTYTEGRMVVVDENDRYGYADGEGKIVIPLEFEWARAFSEGYAAVKFAEGDCGFIDVDGKVLARGFSWAYDFCNGYAEVGVGGTSRMDSQLGFVNRKGEVVPFMDSDRFWPISEDRIWMRTEEDYFSARHLLDGEGNVLTEEPVYLMEMESWAFDEGLQAVANEDGKWGYIGLDGKVVIPLVYNAAYAFDGGLAKVRMGDQVGYIDKTGDVVYMWDSPIE